ncbi:MAG: hypothetical protein PHR47_02065 [Candidatus Pacebacteria bacterium]|nr:hypothetical protein [Candidatus Paceibacterota bacterium]
MSIEISEEKKNISFNWLFQLLFALSILVFLASIGAFIYYQFICIQPNVATLSNLKLNLQYSKPEKERMIEIEAASIQNYVDDYKTLYDQRSKMSKFFSNTETGFESWIHPKVYFSSFSIDTNTRVVSLKGFSNDFKPIIEQLRIIKKMKDSGKNIEQYEISDIKLAEQGGVSFSLVITVKPESIK